MSTDVFLTRSASYLPFAPVTNDEIESVLGMVGGRPSRARRIVLRNNGIVTRHYAIDRATGEIAMSNAQLAANAIRALGDIGKVDVLATGTSTPDQIAPNHGVMVHGELGWPRLEVVSCAGICVSGTAAFKHAYLSVKAGVANRAVAAASELISQVLQARFFKPEAEHAAQEMETRPELAFEKDFLRWMLSDGAGAFVFEPAPRKGELSLRVEWVEMSSAAHELPACMYAGAARDPNTGALTGFARLPQEDWLNDSIFSVRQDVRLLNDNVIRVTLRDALAPVVQKYNLKADDIDWFLPHMSSFYFANQIEKYLGEAGLPIPRERWYTNLATRGNIGSAAPYVILDELWKSGNVKPGQKLLMFIPESGRFSSGFILLEAVQG